MAVRVTQQVAEVPVQDDTANIEARVTQLMLEAATQFDTANITARVTAVNAQVLMAAPSSSTVINYITVNIT